MYHRFMNAAARVIVVAVIAAALILAWPGTARGESRVWVNTERPEPHAPAFPTIEIADD